MKNSLVIIISNKITKSKDLLRYINNKRTIITRTNNKIKQINKTYQNTNLPYKVE